MEGLGFLLSSTIVGSLILGMAFNVAGILIALAIARKIWGKEK